MQEAQLFWKALILSSGWRNRLVTVSIRGWKKKQLVEPISLDCFQFFLDSAESFSKAKKLSAQEASKLPFEEKRKWFRTALEMHRIPWTQGADILRVDRAFLLDSSIKSFQKCNLFKVISCDVKAANVIHIQEVKVEFKGDEKVNDAGGLMREWMSLMVKELVKPDIGNSISTILLEGLTGSGYFRIVCKNRQWRSQLQNKPEGSGFRGHASYVPVCWKDRRQGDIRENYVWYAFRQLPSKSDCWKIADSGGFKIAWHSSNQTCSLLESNKFDLLVVQLVGISPREYVGRLRFVPGILCRSWERRQTDRIMR